MKIALFSDIHANFIAFEAMLADMDEQKTISASALRRLCSKTAVRYLREAID